MSDQSGQAREVQPGSDEPSAPAGSANTGSAVHRGRRALMFGAAAAGAGVAASLAGGGLAEAAPDAGGAVQLGKSNSAKATTQVITKGGDGLKGQTSATNHSGIAGFDTGPGTGGHGVYGNSLHGDGVLGISAHKTGVVGQGSTVGQSGVAGIDISPAAGAHGVFGQSPHGDAVLGTSANGVALHGQSTHGLALRVAGRAKFTQSGVATVPSGHKTAHVAVAGMVASNIVLATIQNPQDGLFLEGAAAGAGGFTISLSASSESSIKVGWMVLD
jgi:hypothetical protein